MGRKCHSIFTARNSRAQPPARNHPPQPQPGTAHAQPPARNHPPEATSPEPNPPPQPPEPPTPTPPHATTHPSPPPPHRTPKPPPPPPRHPNRPRPAPRPHSPTRGHQPGTESPTPATGTESPSPQHGITPPLPQPPARNRPRPATGPESPTPATRTESPSPSAESPPQPPAWGPGGLGPPGNIAGNGETGRRPVSRVSRLASPTVYLRERSRASQKPWRSACLTSSCSRESIGRAEPCSRRASRSVGIRGFLASTASSQSAGASRATDSPNSKPSAWAA